MPQHDDTEFKKMLRGDSYKALDPYIRHIAEQQAAKVAVINTEVNGERRNGLLKDLCNIEPASRVIVAPPFFCEYGFNITIGDDVYLAPGLTILDICPVRIGARCLFAPNVQLYAASHPISPEARNGCQGEEFGAPVTIGNDCWIGGGVIICPGITIGNGVTIGAGSVVTKDVPDRVVVAGNPARIIKTIPLPEDDNKNAVES